MTNSHGLDVDYFSRKMERMLSGADRYTRTEWARECARMARVADEAVLLEVEFVGELPQEAARYRYLRDTAQMRFKPAGSCSTVKTAEATDAAIDAEIAQAALQGGV